MNRKPSLRVVMTEGMEMVPKIGSLFNCWFYNPVTIFSLCLFAHAYHVVFQLVKKFSYLYLTVVFCMYMDRLVCSNIDINKEAIREK